MYKLLTAEDLGAQKAAIKMLTFLCQVDSEWREQEQLKVASFGSGAILLNLVDRMQLACHKRKVSAVGAAELGSIMNLVSSATAGMHRHQSMSCTVV